MMHYACCSRWIGAILPCLLVRKHIVFTSHAARLFTYARAVFSLSNQQPAWLLPRLLPIMLLLLQAAGPQQPEL
jgi:hypothetical protein